MNANSGISRREFLRLLTIGGAGAALVASGLPGASLKAANRAAQGAVARAQGGEVVLPIAGWPYEPLPETEPEGGWTAPQEALRAWLDANPNVRLERVEVGIWDTGALRTAVAGGTAPTYFLAGVLGVWTLSGIQAAFAQGMVADLTEQYTNYDIFAKYAEGVQRGKVYYARGDQFFGLVPEFSPGNGLIYRKDWIEELGLEAPGTETTWEDIRELCRAITTDERKGIAMQPWGLGAWMLRSEGLGENELFSVIPDPASSWNWRWDYTSNPEAYQAAIGRYRAMKFEDQTLVSDTAIYDGEMMQQFVNGLVGIATIPLQFFYAPPGEELKAAMAAIGPVREWAGVAPHPRGVNGHYNRESKPFVQSLSMSPDLSTEQKDAATSLYMFMELEDGFDMIRRRRFEETGDLAQVFSPYPFVRARQEIEGIEGTPVDAWGESYINTVEYIASVGSGYPDRGEFLPPEEDAGPTGDAWGDANSRLMFEAGDLDIMEILQNAQDTVNAQAAGFTSSTPDDQFVEGAAAYYQAHIDYWSTQFPDFYESTFAPWYESVIRPALGI